eukprot:353275-Chlamydomonas_euryale.AAC.1
MVVRNSFTPRLLRCSFSGVGGWAAARTNDAHDVNAVRPEGCSPVVAPSGVPCTYAQQSTHPACGALTHADTRPGKPGGWLRGKAGAWPPGPGKTGGWLRGVPSWVGNRAGRLSLLRKHASTNSIASMPAKRTPHLEFHMGH